MVKLTEAIKSKRKATTKMKKRIGNTNVYKNQNLQKDTAEKETEMKQKRKIFLSAIPAVVMMAVIFLFSSKNADQSNATSTPIAEKALEAYEALFGEAKMAEESWFSILHHLIRKAAHMTEFGVLTILLAFHFKVRGFSGLKLFLYSSAAGIGYAATDEFHQLFVPGRSGQISDVLIDGAGAVTGAALFLLAIRIYSGKHHKNIESRPISE